MGKKGKYKTKKSTLKMQKKHMKTWKMLLN